MIQIPTIKQNFIDRYANWIAGGLLGLMLILSVTSMTGDSAIMDEIAHIPAGYSYVRYLDFRINPEHPPLIKSLAGLPLLLMNLNFPLDHTSWTSDINGQWTSGPEFLYERNNGKADQILFWSRVPMVLVMMLLGFFVFKWTKELAGEKAALIATFLFALSPNIITHGRFVTTDVGLAAFLIISLYYFVKFLNEPSAGNTSKFGLTFGLVQLAKFSAFMLVPYYFLVVFLWIAVKIINLYANEPVTQPKMNKLRSEESKAMKIWEYIKIYLGKAILANVIAYLLVGAVYGILTWKEPPSIIKRDISTILESNQYYNNLNLEEKFFFMADNPVLKGYSVYTLGLVMVFQRATGGNTTYFLGEVSSQGWKSYFPLTFLMKEPIPSLIIIFSALVVLLLVIVKNIFSIRFSLKEYLKSLAAYIIHNPASITIFGFICMYWLSSITSNLNIGFRHILPTVPLMYILSSKMMVKVNGMMNEKLVSMGAKTYYGHYIILGVLGVWLLGSNLYNYPLYLPYFNEFVGSKNGYTVIVDSNVDWGQDLKRLAKFVEKNDIQKIRLDYFGGGSPKYYLGSKYEKWESSRVPLEGGWYAISATPFQTSFENPATSYAWLTKYELAEVVGHSILVYKVEAK